MDRHRHPDGLAFGPWIAPDGAALRSFAWAATPARGTLLFLGGRGDFAEKYLEAMAHWHRRGWSVIGFDWRGQGGSGRYSPDRAIHHLDDLDPLVGDLAAFATQATASGPVVAVAHSMGGHLLLRAVAERGVPIGRMALAAPMVGLRAGLLGTRAIAAAARLAIAAGRRERALWTGDAGNVGGRMTSCPDRQADKLWWKAQAPSIASGAPSWGLTAALCRSITRLDPAALARIRCPVLMLIAARDPIVSVAAARRAERAIPDARLQVIPGRGHELLREADAMRLAAMAAIDAFLEA